MFTLKKQLEENQSTPIKFSSETIKIKSWKIDIHGKGQRRCKNSRRVYKWSSEKEYKYKLKSRSKIWDDWSLSAYKFEELL